MKWKEYIEDKKQTSCNAKCTLHYEKYFAFGRV